MNHKRDWYFQGPIIDSTSVYAESYDLANIFKKYTERNGKNKNPTSIIKIILPHIVQALSSVILGVLWLYDSYVSVLYISVTTQLNAPYSVWRSGRGAGQPFVLSSNITYTEQMILYPFNHISFLSEQTAFTDIILLWYIFSVNVLLDRQTLYTDEKGVMLI